MNLKTAFQVAAIYAGSIIGAGFASGQEILQFFIVHGRRGVLGVILAGSLFAFFGAQIMHLAVRFRMHNYRQMLVLSLGPGISRFFDLLSLFMLAGGLLVMLSGAGAVASEYLGISGRLGSLTTALLTAAVLWRGTRGVAEANMLLVPVKAGIIILLCLTTLYMQKDHITPAVARPGTGPEGGWLFAALLYVSYNLVVPLSVLTSLGREVERVSAVLGGICGGLLLGLIILLVTITGLLYYPDIAAFQIPLLYIAGQTGSVWNNVLGILIWLAIFTTAIADAHGFAARLGAPGTARYRLAGLLLLLAALPLSGLPFAGLVKYLYPLFGYLGLVLLVGLLLLPLRLRGEK